MISRSRPLVPRSRAFVPALAAIALTLAGAALAFFVHSASQHTLDEPMLEDVQAFTFGMKDLTWFFNVYLRDTGIPYLWLLSIVAFAWARRWDLVLLFMAGILVGASNHELKTFFDRPRPAGDFFVRESPGDSSFPSGHVMGAMAFFGLWWVVAPHVFGTGRVTRLVRMTGLLAVVLTAVSRVWAGAHWPTDTLAGIAFGGAFVAALWALHQLISHHGALAAFTAWAHHGERRVLGDDDHRPPAARPLPIDLGALAAAALVR